MLYYTGPLKYIVQDGFPGSLYESHLYTYTYTQRGLETLIYITLLCLFKALITEDVAPEDNNY